MSERVSTRQGAPAIRSAPASLARRLWKDRLIYLFLAPMLVL
jgi:hypothetical protein